MSRVLHRATSVFRAEGLHGVLQRVRIKFREIQLRESDATFRSRALPVKDKDLFDPYLSKPLEIPAPVSRASMKSLKISWVMSPPSPGSGGHQNLFRFIRFLEDAGHECAVYFYSNSSYSVNEEAMKAMLKASGNYPNVDASMQMFDDQVVSTDGAHALFATSWETAYPVKNSKSNARRFYFVQDFEPFFYASGTESLLAENTYKFGFTAVTAGGWLSQKLSSDYGCETSHFDFSVDHQTYSLTNSERRSAVFFYARPSTPRRGFELGMLALEEFAKRCPEVEIHIAGEDLELRSERFNFVSHGMLPLANLANIYNSCAAGLVISSTNMSLLPLELLACGVVPVVNDGPNNSFVSRNPGIRYVDALPGLLADELVKISQGHETVPTPSELASTVSDTSWDQSGAEFVRIMEGYLYA